MNTSRSGDQRHRERRIARLRTFLTGTTLTFLKPRLKRLVHPAAAFLARNGTTANQVTLKSLAGSIAVGAVLTTFSDRPALFGMLPVWALARTGCTSLDGTLAVEFGQKSRLGGVLNEAGDLISEIALFLPFAFISARLSALESSMVMALILLSEFAGLVGLVLAGDRRVEGPLRKADR